MKKIFYVSAIAFILYEVLNVFFIMPMPGSQEIESIDLAYLLNKYKWLFRTVLTLGMLMGLVRSDWTKKWVPLLTLLFAGVIFYIVNYTMAADTMFYQPETLLMKPMIENKVDTNRIIIGIANDKEAKAYPIQYIGYHHQIRDELGGTPIMITYCTVCRTGRAYEPKIKDKIETFRLVGMDHFNAMFEDKTTKSWWRQVTGQAVAGPLKGAQLPEVISYQMTLSNWAKLHPNTLVMQADPKFQTQYDSMSIYETKGKSALTKTDTSSWNRKSWVIGIVLNGKAKAFDWNRLKKNRVINDEVGGRPIAIVLADDGKTFVAFERPMSNEELSIEKDIIMDVHHNQYKLNGDPIKGNISLKRVPAFQEFWHSWQQFHKETERG